ncbi:hypothetical protein PMAYCL1PPCAC_28766 [Pristionchus mayeri]|uniref:C2H2-type domain-containing protein n=1 Tax=Pristionchus mayeri TaxID=1317129 RepID=A0AAN5D8V7_9BILA|nr:hypothetical protein PMAYCL1PPCAC_28766 [Pristionchus mayeri]
MIMSIDGQINEQGGRAEINFCNFTRLGDLSKEAIIQLNWLSSYDNFTEDLRTFFEKTLQLYSRIQKRSGGVDHTADLPEIPRTRKSSRDAPSLVRDDEHPSGKETGASFLDPSHSHFPTETAADDKENAPQASSSKDQPNEDQMMHHQQEHSQQLVEGREKGARKSRWEKNEPVNSSSMESTTTTQNGISTAVAEAKVRVHQIVLLKQMKDAQEREVNGGEEPMEISSPDRPSPQPLELIHLKDKSVTCVFCDALDHSSLLCKVYTLWELRNQIRLMNNLCFHCLGQFRPECKLPSHRKKCTHCGAHESHPALCKHLYTRPPLLPSSSKQ